MKQYILIKLVTNKRKFEIYDFSKKDEFGLCPCVYSEYDQYSGPANLHWIRERFVDESDNFDDLVVSMCMSRL